MEPNRSDSDQQGRDNDAPRDAGRRDSSPGQSPQYEKNRRGPDARTTPVSEPPLPYDEEPPPLPAEAPPEDDGWEARWDHNNQVYYFFNRFTQLSQWENPRVPEASASANNYGSYDRYTTNAAPGTYSTPAAPGTYSTAGTYGAYSTAGAPGTYSTAGAPGTYSTAGAPGTTSSAGAPGTSSPPKRPAGGYNPAIHGNYDPNADYAVAARKQEEEEEAAAASAAALAAGLPDPNQNYAATGQFNRFTGRFQAADVNPENHNDEAKSHRQLNAFFDVDAAANSHDGRSLKAERRNKTLSKKELKAFKDKRRERKEEKRRAWLRD